MQIRKNLTQRDLLAPFLRVYSDISGIGPSTIKWPSVAAWIVSTVTPGARSKSLNPCLVTSITAKLVNLAEKKKKRISEMSLDEIRSIDKKIGTEVLNVIKVNNSVKSKSSFGGTSFDNVKKMIKKYKKQIND